MLLACRSGEAGTPKLRTTVAFERRAGDSIAIRVEAVSLDGCLVASARSCSLARDTAGEHLASLLQRLWPALTGVWPV